MEIKFIYSVGKRADSSLVYTADKQLFKFYRNKTDSIKQYRCYRTGCKAKVVIQDGICSYERLNATHIHQDNQEKERQQFALEHKIKQRCQSNPKLNIRQIFEEESGSLSDSSVSFEKMKSSMIRNKKKYLPQNPNKAEDVHQFLNNQMVQEILNEDGFPMSCEFVNENEYPYLMFECTQLLQALPEERQLIFNCSMRVVPKGFFTSLLTIMVLKNDKVIIGLSCALLSSK